MLVILKPEMVTSLAWSLITACVGLAITASGARGAATSGSQDVLGEVVAFGPSKFSDLLIVSQSG